MFCIKRILTSFQNGVNTSTRNYKISVVGGATEIGQTVSLMLKTQPAVTDLTIHDTSEHTHGVALDLFHVPTETPVKGYTGDTIHNAVENADLILITGGMTKMPGIPATTLLHNNFHYIRNVCNRISRSRMPFIGIATEPVNAIVPMAAEILKCQGDYNPRKLFGITGIDVIRAQTLLAAEHNLSPFDCYVPIIGGHTEKTMIPLMSKARPTLNMSENHIINLTKRFLEVDDHITHAKRGWAASLSVAYSILVFTQGIVNALNGQPSQVHAYIENNDFGTWYFSGLIDVDQNGANEMHRYNNLSPYEFQLLETSIIELRADVKEGRRLLEMV